MTAAVNPPAWLEPARPASLTAVPSTGRVDDEDSPLTAARKAAGLTTTELARVLHLSRPTVSMWEHGARGVSREYWPALGRALGVTASEVVALCDGGPAVRLDGVRLPGLATARRGRATTGRALAAQVGVAASTLSMWETAGVPVPQAIAHQLASHLGQSLDALTQTPTAVGEDPRPLRRWRRQAGMTGREAAAFLDISVGTLARYEAGARDTPVTVLRRMALIYRQPTADLLKTRAQPLPRLPAAPWTGEEVPAVIHTMRVHVGLTKADLGRRVARSGQAVHAWETGTTHPTAQTRRRLEAVLCLPVNSLPGRRPAVERDLRVPGHP